MTQSSWALRNVRWSDPLLVEPPDVVQPWADVPPDVAGPPVAVLAPPLERPGPPGAVHEDLHVDVDLLRRLTDRATSW